MVEKNPASLIACTPFQARYSSSAAAAPLTPIAPTIDPSVKIKEKEILVRFRKDDNDFIQQKILGVSYLPL